MLAPVHITGSGAVSRAGIGTGKLWRHCLEKRALQQDGLARVLPEDLENAAAGLRASRWVQRIPPAPSKSLLFALSSILQAVEQAGWECFQKSDVLLIGTTTGQLGSWEGALLPGTRPDSDLSKRPLAALSDDLRSALGFPGKIVIVASACSASTQAIGMAWDYLQSGRAGRCVVGGVEELGQLTITGFTSLKLLVQTGCRPFDRQRNGINLSEGAAFYAVEKNRGARAHARLYAGRTFLDSFHMTSPDPEGKGLSRAIQACLKANSMDAGSISLVHAHGTGSFHNDQSEARAIQQNFGGNVPVFSSKGVHGHALGASGALELGISLMALREGTLPPTAGLEEADPDFGIHLPMGPVKKAPTFILKTTLGFGGVNSAFVIGAPDA